MTTRFAVAVDGKRSPFSHAMASFICLTGLVGCGARSAPPLQMAPVKGVVLFREKPLANARVNFFAKKATTPVFGETNEAGEFEIKGGAPVGENKITVISLDAAGSASPFMPDPTKLDAAPTAGPASAERPKQSSGVELPMIYGDAINSPLSLTLKPEGDLNVKIELK